MNYEYLKPIMPFIFSCKDVIKLNDRLLLIILQLKQITKIIGENKPEIVQLLDKRIRKLNFQHIFPIICIKQIKVNV